VKATAIDLIEFERRINPLFVYEHTKSDRLTLFPQGVPTARFQAKFSLRDCG
jgi:hypothetical protein